MSTYRLIAAEKANHPISLLCELLSVSRSGFYAWERRPPSSRDLGDAWLLELIKDIHGQNRRVYGAPRIHAEDPRRASPRAGHPRRAQAR